MTANLSTLIRTEREAKGLSRDSLAHTVGASVSTITRMELLGMVPRAATLLTIARELGIPLNVLDEAVTAQEEANAQRQPAEEPEPAPA